MYRTLVIGCVLKDEAPQNLLEWVIYHKHLGVEHFYLCDNESEIPVQDTLTRYGLGDVCTVERIRDDCAVGKWTDRQCEIYQRMIDRYGDSSKWMALVDADEFIFPLAGQSIPEFLKFYEHAPGLGIRWRTFGSSGHDSHPKDQLVIESYVHRVPDEHHGEAKDGNNNNTKSIVQPRFIKRALVHSHIYLDGRLAVDEKFGPIPEGWAGDHSLIGPVQSIAINHYCIKSRADYDHKIRRNSVKYPEYRKIQNELWDGVERRATVVDAGIWCHLPAVKTEMMKRYFRHR